MSDNDKREEWEQLRLVLTTMKETGGDYPLFDDAISYSHAFEALGANSFGVAGGGADGGSMEIFWSEKGVRFEIGPDGSMKLLKR